MKKINSVLGVLLLAALLDVSPAFSAENDTGSDKLLTQELDSIDNSSNYLVQKAWSSLAARDFDAAASYANKAIELYAPRAREMQASLTAYPSGGKEQIFEYWALNDVGAAFFILGEAYRNAGQPQEALKTYQKIIDEYSYAQCWDPQGWFWKPASVAQDRLDVAAAGEDVDFGNYDSKFLLRKAWAASDAQKMKSVALYVHKIEELYGDKAREMQASLKTYPAGSKEQISRYWALNDVGTALFILAEMYRNAGLKADADRLYRRVAEEYYYAQAWDPQGWFWKPAEVSGERLGRNTSLAASRI